MRIGILALQHESNTFIRTPTTLDMFRQGGLVTGDAIAGQYEDAHHEIGGFYQGVREAGEELVPIFAAWALPSGRIADEALQQMLAMMFEELERAGPLDGLLVAPHGAGVSESHRDMDGHWLSLVREQMGPSLPIVCTLDPHVNLSPRMVEACHATIAYRSNAHLDQRQRGLEAAKLLLRTLRGEIKPTQAAAFPRVAINIERQETAIMPARMLYEQADEMLTRPGVLSNSVTLGFPYADVAEMGSAFIVVTDNDAAQARQLADELAEHLWQNRHAFVAELISIDEAVEAAIAADGPVCLLDMGDNVGGGSPADGTLIAHALHRLTGGDLKSFVAINDPRSVVQAVSAGIGGRVELCVGGKTDDLHGPPLEAVFEVRALHDGAFSESKARHGGQTAYNMGQAAVVETDNGLTVQLTSRRLTPFSLNQLTCCGLDPSSFQILVAKGVVAPVAAYEEVCTRFIRVNTPGVTTADMLSLDYQHRRRPLFPFEDGATWK